MLKTLAVVISLEKLTLFSVFTRHNCEKHKPFDSMILDHTVNVGKTIELLLNCINVNSLNCLYNLGSLFILLFLSLHYFSLLLLQKWQ